MIKRTTYIITAIIAAAALIVLSCSTDKTPGITVRNATFMPSKMMIGAASAFMEIVNDGSGNDMMTGCSIKEYPSVRGEIHDVVDGKMKKLNQIKIPSQETVDLKKGSKHLMFFDCPEDMSGDVTLVLNFEKTGAIEATATVNSN